MKAFTNPKIEKTMLPWKEIDAHNASGETRPIWSYGAGAELRARKLRAIGALCENLDLDRKERHNLIRDLREETRYRSRIEYTSGSAPDGSGYVHTISPCQAQWRVNYLCDYLGVPIRVVSAKCLQINSTLGKGR